MLTKLLTCALLSIAFASTAQAETINLKTNSKNPNEILFLVAQAKMQSGNLADAERILKALSKKTNSPRVLLDLGRVLFLQRKYTESKAVFKGVLSENTVPWSVREKVHHYIRQIEAITGSVKFSFEIVKDTNPSNFTSEKEITIFGNKMKIVVPDEAKEVHGVKVGLQASKALNEKRTLVSYANASVTKYEVSELDRVNIDAGMSHRLSKQFKVKGGVQTAFTGGKHQYQQPYVGLTYFPDFVNEFNMQFDAGIARLDVIDSNNYDATVLTASISGSKLLSERYALSTSVSLEKSNAEFDANGFAGIGATIALKTPVHKGWTLEPSARFNYRNFDASDPFFGEVRSDSKKFFSLVAYNRDFRFRDLIPKIGVEYTKNDSNLEYYSYEKTNVILKLEY
jgi:hypothetical protein